MKRSPRQPLTEQIMTMSALARTAEPKTPPIDLPSLKARQQAAWSSGDYAVVGTTLQIVGEELCEALDIRSGQSVLDVAAGNGNASLAAARRWCDVTATDYVPALLERARERAASELARVAKRGGKVGLANWTPEGFIGQLFKTIGKHLPPPNGAQSPALWGTRTRLAELFEPHASHIQSAQRNFVFRYRSPEHWLEIFRSYYGPVLKAFAALAEPAQAALERDLVALVQQFNDASDGTMVVPSEYLEVVITID